MRGREGGDPDRGVSITLNYILALGISAVLVTGLIIAGGNFVQDQRERVIEGELEIVGQHVASNLETVDRFAQASGGSPDAAHVNQTFQSHVSGASYTIQLEGTPDQVVLSSERPDVTVRVNVTVSNALDTDSFTGGGSVSVYFDDSSGELVITDA